MFWDKNSLVIKIIMTTATIITIVMIRMITKRERGIKSKKKRTHAKCSLPTGQCLFYSMPKQWPPDSSPQLINWTWCSMVWNNTLASLDQVLWSCFISAFCAAPHWQNTTHWKVLDFMPTLSATAKTLMCYQHYSHDKSKTQYYTRYQEEYVPAESRTHFNSMVQVMSNCNCWKMKLFLTLLWSSRHLWMSVRLLWLTCPPVILSTSLRVR